MEVIAFLVPLALLLGLFGLLGFLWSLKNGQYDDLEGAAAAGRSPTTTKRPRLPNAAFDCWRNDGNLPSPILKMQNYGRVPWHRQHGLNRLRAGLIGKAHGLPRPVPRHRRDPQPQHRRGRLRRA